MKVVADSHSIYWYLAKPELLSGPALAALGEAEDTDGVVVSAWTIPELWMSATRKRRDRSVPRSSYELVRATLVDPTTVRFEGSRSPSGDGVEAQASSFGGR